MTGSGLKLRLRKLLPGSFPGIFAAPIRPIGVTLAHGTVGVVHHGNLLTQISQDLPDELITHLAGGPGARIERIVSRGHHSPEGFWYDQEQAEFVLLVAGAAVIELEGAPSHALSPGDWLDIPAHTRHRVAWTDPACDTIWLAVFYES